MKQTIIFFFALVVVFASCKTEVDLNAPYKSTTIIFGLLDPDSNGDGVTDEFDIQWIKINRTFLGEGDNTVYAGIRDSSEYSEEDFVKKVVYELRNGEIVNTFVLKSDTILNSDMNGIFYGPEQTAYFFTPPTTGLDANSEYRIELEFTDGRVVTATSNAVNSGSLNWLSPQPNATFILATKSSNGRFNYTSEVAIKWNAATNASLYDARLRFHYTELVYETDNWSVPPISSTPKFLDYYIGSISGEDVTSGQMLRLTFDGRAFFSFLKNNLVADERIRRVIGTFDSNQQRTECFDVTITMANEDLKSYIQVNSPSTGLVQERPIYTNVSNGIGLFASRSSRSLLNLPLIAYDNNNQAIQGNLQALCDPINNEYTVGLNFCDPNGASDFSCNN
jgi:hypothetical protein